MKLKIFYMLLIGLAVLTAVLTACASPAEAPAATPTQLVFATETLPFLTTETVSPLNPSPIATSDLTTIPVVTSTPVAGSVNVCSDPQSTALIDSLKTAVTTKNGELLASLVSPANGMDVAFYHNGTVIKYDQQHARFLFETTFEANWGLHPASGEAKVGSFHDVVIPELEKSFNQPYTLHCNELKFGGASYPVNFPYNKDFYSIYYPGTEANGNLDWHTWVVGIEYVNGKPHIYALTQFFWEP